MNEPCMCCCVCDCGRSHCGMVIMGLSLAMEQLLITVVRSAFMFVEHCVCLAFTYLYCRNVLYLEEQK